MTAAGNCLRLITSLMMYEKYGSIISTTLYMFNDVAIFIVVWYLVLMSFSMVALFVFSEVKALESLPNAMIYFYNSSLGGYDLTIFDVYEQSEPKRYILKWFGVIFVVFFVFLNLLILLNVLIAMMADTYAVMSSQRKGLFNYGVIRAVPAYKTNKIYGGLLFNVFPCSVITFFLLPFYIVIKNTDTLTAITRISTTGHYTFVMLFIGFAYIVGNLILLPFAYLKTVAHKVSLLARRRVSLIGCLLYVVFGLPLLIVSQFTDFYTFLLVSYSSRKRYQSDEVFTVSLDQFNLFHMTVLEAHNRNVTVKAHDLVHFVRKAFKIDQNLTVALYGTIPSSKSFGVEDFKGIDSEALREQSVKVVKAYVQTKHAIWNCTKSVDENGEAIPTNEQEVDMDLLLGQMAEIRLLLDLHKQGLTTGLTQQRILRRFSLIISNKITKAMTATTTE